MARIWDITPRKKPRKLKPAEKKERRANISWFFFLAVVGAFFIVFFGASKIPPALETNPTSSPTPMIKACPSPSAKTQTNATIKLLNGTGRVEEAQKVQDLLGKAGFRITATENALNLYPRTIVYYQPSFENYARDLTTVLKSYNPEAQKFTQDTQYDIVIVIGSQ